MEIVLVKIHLLSCLVMTGLIWCIQLVHYPSFMWVEKKRFVNFTQFHGRNISLLVIPFMLLELITGVIAPFTALGAIIPTPLLVLNLGTVGLTWASTFLLSVPCHQQLAKGFDEKKIHKLA